MSFSWQKTTYLPNIYFQPLICYTHIKYNLCFFKRKFSWNVKKFELLFILFQPYHEISHETDIKFCNYKYGALLSKIFHCYKGVQNWKQPSWINTVFHNFQIFWVDHISATYHTQTKWSKAIIIFLLPSYSSKGHAFQI
jgi:hypothetical protein